MEPELEALHPTAAFVAALTGSPDTPMVWLTYRDLQPGHAGERKEGRIFTGPFCTVKAEIDAAAERLAVAVGINPGGPTNDKITGFRAIWVDIDDPGRERADLDLTLPPQIITRTGHGWHLYWLLQPGVDEKTWRQAGKSLAQYHRSDRNVYDPARRMRVPGYYHRKGEPKLVVSEYNPVPPYRLDLVVSAYPSILQNEKRERGVDGERNRILKARAGVLIGQHLTVEQVVDELQKINGTFEAGGLSPERVRGLAEWAVGEEVKQEDDFGPDVSPRLVRDEKGAPIVGVPNAEILLAYHSEWKGCLAWDEFAHKAVWAKPPARTSIEPGADFREVVEAARFVQRVFKKDFPPRIAGEAATAAAKHVQFHPIRDYLRGLKWDGEPRLDSWVARYTGCEDSPFVRAAGRKWLISAVARVMQPGCKADYVLFFYGEQGLRKSEIGNSLAGKWFTQLASSMDNKDFGIDIQGKWIIELSELASFRRSLLETVKQTITRAVDRFRVPYEAGSTDFPRQCLFYCTTNSDTGLTDPTGNRRFWPIHVVKRVNSVALSAERDQLWAEAFHAYQDGEQWYLTEDLEEAARAAQAEVTACDGWESYIEDWLNLTPETAKRADPLWHPPPYTLREILEGAIGKTADRQTNYDLSRVADIMKKLGWEAARHNNKRVWRKKP